LSVNINNGVNSFGIWVCLWYLGIAFGSGDGCALKGNIFARDSQPVSARTQNSQPARMDCSTVCLNPVIEVGESIHITYNATQLVNKPVPIQLALVPASTIEDSDPCSTSDFLFKWFINASQISALSSSTNATDFTIPSNTTVGTYYMQIRREGSCVAGPLNGGVVLPFKVTAASVAAPVPTPSNSNPAPSDTLPSGSDNSPSSSSATVVLASVFAVVALLLAFLALWFWRRNRRRNETQDKKILFSSGSDSEEEGPSRSSWRSSGLFWFWRSEQQHQLRDGSHSPGSLNSKSSSSMLMGTEYPPLPADYVSSPRTASSSRRIVVVARDACSLSRNSRDVSLKRPQRDSKDTSLARSLKDGILRDTREGSLGRSSPRDAREGSLGRSSLSRDICSSLSRDIFPSLSRDSTALPRDLLTLAPTDASISGKPLLDTSSLLAPAWSEGPSSPHSSAPKSLNSTSLSRNKSCSRSRVLISPEDAQLLGETFKKELCEPCVGWDCAGSAVSGSRVGLQSSLVGTFRPEGAKGNGSEVLRGQTLTQEPEDVDQESTSLPQGQHVKIGVRKKTEGRGVGLPDATGLEYTPVELELELPTDRVRVHTPSHMLPIRNNRLSTPLPLQSSNAVDVIEAVPENRRCSTSMDVPL
jgi:hypothetical protein